MCGLLQQDTDRQVPKHVTEQRSSTCVIVTNVAQWPVPLSPKHLPSKSLLDVFSVLMFRTQLPQWYFLSTTVCKSS